MLCNACSCEVSDELDICPECGKIIEASEKSAQTTENANQKPIETQTSEEFIDLGEKADPVAAEEFISDVSTDLPLLGEKPPKKPVSKKAIALSIVAGVALVVLAITGIIAYSNLIGFEELAWNQEFGDYQLEYISQSKADLAFVFSDEQKIDDIKLETTCGKIKQTGQQLSWNLKKCLGETTVTVAHKGKKIEKTFTVIDPVALRKADLKLSPKKINTDADDEDTDGDGLSNAFETKQGTSLTLADTDGDGLDDKYEIEESETDPTKADSDDDGIDDYNEIQLGLDPNEADSKKDGTTDGQRQLSYEYKKDNITLKLSGNGNLATTSIETYKDSKITEQVGLIPVLYDIYSAGDITSATLEIPYTDELLQVYDIDEDQLCLFYYIATDGKYEKVNSVVNKVGKKLLATLNHFSLYALGDKSKVQEKINSDILFILDNSWSLYGNEQYKEITGEDWAGGLFDIDPKLDAYDSEGKRFTITSKLVDKLSKKGFNLGLSEFRADYANAQKIGSSASNIKKSLNKMKGNFITKQAGTNITNAIESGIKEFNEKSSNAKYIVLLTDGQDDSLQGNTKSLIQKANASNIKVCSVGFGGSIQNIPLMQISKGTGCNFFSSTNVDGLAELFGDIQIELDRGLIDTNNNGIPDSLVIANSGFITSRDGFSFENYRSDYSEDGHCYGMAVFAELYYLNKLPTHMGVKTPKNENESKSHEFTLDSDFFRNHQSLYQYRFTTNALKHMLGYEFFGENEPKSVYIKKLNTLAFTDSIRKEIDKSNLYKVATGKSGLSEEDQIAKYGFKYSNSERLLLKYTEIEKNLTEEEAAVFNAIYAFLIEQENIPRISSGLSKNELIQIAGLLAKDYFNEIFPTSNGMFLSILETMLLAGDPVPLTIDGGGHAVNAISLSKDITNPSIYNIGVYDNNHPGQKRYLKLNCAGGIVCLQAENEYYGKSDAVGIRIPWLQDADYFAN